MDNDATSSDFLIHTIIVDNDFSISIFIPNLDAECVRIFIACPDHELVFTIAIDGAGALEPGIVTASDHQPLIAATVEVEVGGLELEFGIAGGYRSTFLVFGYETECGFAF